MPIPRSLLGVISIVTFSVLPAVAAGPVATVWLTTADKSSLLAQQPEALHFSKQVAGQRSVIEVDDKQTFQGIDGFGFAMTGGSAHHIMRMDADKRSSLLQELFSTKGAGIGVSYLRMTIGASDLNDHVYSYDDVPDGQTDPTLSHFSLDEDRAEVIPAMKAVLAINPSIQILGTPWSAPSWMKSNGKVKGGSLKPEFYDVYAKYLVKYIEGMRAEGIRIDAITPQNEPLNPKNTPSMVMLAPEEEVFVRDHLGPAFKAAGIDTKIILFDHNCNHPDYPLTVLDDQEAAKYVTGSGFHLYEGSIDAMTQVHVAHPDKGLYFTEYMAVGPGNAPTLPIARPVQETFIGATRNWSRNVLLWNIAANSKFEPHTNDGGCGICEGAVSIDGNTVTRNVAYYVVGHFAKFVRRGSVRIASNSSDTLPNVAFRTPDHKFAVVVSNPGTSPQTFDIKFRGKYLAASLPAGSVATYVW
jgi:glucosylceramidase